MRQISRIVIMASAAFVLAFAAQAQDATDATAKMSDPAPTKSADNPIEQGSSKVDLATTKRIRKEIMAANNLSVNAQNVKIITSATKVTLRGPVDTAKDKRLIGEIAERHAPPGNVDNQLEVQVLTD